ncbi:MAG TPA: hypothetical protein VGL46_21525 [Pseudonocardiaceae bacterium]|jgi:hypothetical protein
MRTLAPSGQRNQVPVRADGKVNVAALARVAGVSRLTADRFFRRIEQGTGRA